MKPRPSRLPSPAAADVGGLSPTGERRGSLCCGSPTTESAGVRRLPTGAALPGSPWMVRTDFAGLFVESRLHVPDRAPLRSSFAMVCRLCGQPRLCRSSGRPDSLCCERQTVLARRRFRGAAQRPNRLARRARGERPTREARPVRGGEATPISAPLTRRRGRRRPLPDGGEARIAMLWLPNYGVSRFAPASNRRGFAWIPLDGANRLCRPVCRISIARIRPRPAAILFRYGVSAVRAATTVLVVRTG